MTRFFAMAAALVLWAGAAMAAETVRVGGYDFPPFVETDSKGQAKGLTLDMIELLNKAQDRYEFRFVPTSARRRYGDLTEAKFDLILFESPEWEWAGRNYPVDFSNVFLRGGEVFIAQAKPGRGQDYFSDLKGKRLVGILGYHYGFANFNADPDTLAQTWNMKLVNSHHSSIQMVLAGRVDVAVVTDAYLGRYLTQNPDAKGSILASDRYDQIYNHRILVRRGGPIAVDEVNKLLTALEKDGSLTALWRASGLVR